MWKQHASYNAAHLRDSALEAMPAAGMLYVDLVPL